MPARHRRTYGRQAPDISPPFPKPASDIGLSTPVGVVQDLDGRVWVADAGNSRLLVFDRDLERILQQVGTAGTEPGEFDLPFRLAHHPSKRRVFVTDLGNARIQELEYGPDSLAVTVEQVFSTDSEAFHPNGIAVHDGTRGLDIFVADEFYHEDPTDTRSRIVRFDGTGTQQASFRTVRDDGDEIGLYWPQGLDTDPNGNLLVANTGYGQQAAEAGRPAYYATVLRCDRDGQAVPFASTGSVSSSPTSAAATSTHTRWRGTAAGRSRRSSRRTSNHGVLARRWLSPATTPARIASRPARFGAGCW